MNEILIPEEEVLRLYQKLKSDAESSGYYLNPDWEFTKELIYGLAVNIKRYGYPSCPCRIATGQRSLDLDIICPCDYRDSDLNEYGFCYCGLYVSKEVIEKNIPVHSIPERRNLNIKSTIESSTLHTLKIAFPIWRCRVCGYLCAREAPPEVCPICKASKERFDRFL
jgi:ferredoxin-thioredoxin reductase catalytic subunit